MYCATPPRLFLQPGVLAKITQFIIDKGYTPCHSSDIFPFKPFGGTDADKAERIRLCSQEIIARGLFGLFGLSNATMQDTRVALEAKKRIEFYVREFDPDWRRYYPKLRHTFGDFLDSFFKERNLL